MRSNGLGDVRGKWGERVRRRGGEQSGKEVASWIPMLNERTRSWHSRNRSSLMGVFRNSLRRVWRDGGGGCCDSVHEGVGNVDMVAI